jgi:exodeoxyribonuclease V alpha subunit
MMPGTMIAASLSNTPANPGSYPTGISIYKGSIKSILHHSEETHWLAARFCSDDDGEEFSITGTHLAPKVGESLEISGAWTYHPKFGRQFKVGEFKIIPPQNEQGIMRFLGSGLIRGIGPKTAEKIVQKFGLKTLEIIEREPARLCEIRDIGRSKMEKIVAGLEEHRDIQQVMVFLQGYGISSHHAIKIYKAYRHNAIPLLRENPYRMIYDIDGIGFLTADSIARKMGLDPNSIARAKAGLVYVLTESMGHGHVYMPQGLLFKECQETLGLAKDILEKAFGHLLTEGLIRIDALADFHSPLVYLRSCYEAEVEAAAGLRHFLAEKSYLIAKNPEQSIIWVEKISGLTLAQRQREAIIKALTTKLLIITGGPGTGKTTILKSIIDIFSREGLRITLCAPTGRAAKRLSDLTGLEGKTIHRTLEFNPQTKTFEYDQGNPLPTDLVIVDEVSMIDIFLFRTLVLALPKQAHLILVGDVDQLPSVGPGNILLDLIHSGRLETVKLDKIFRQDEQSFIVSNAHRINQGLLPKLPTIQPGQLYDFYFIQKEEPDGVLQTIIQLVTERIPARFGFEPASDIQILSPMHKGPIGTMNLNKELQERINPSRLMIRKGTRQFKLNDKVMQLRNNYEKAIFNGNIGRIIGINPEDNSVDIQFDDILVNYEFDELDEIELAYAISIHKSQGNEFPCVVIPVHTQHFVMLQRNLLYTGITRGKKLVILVGNMKALYIAIKNNVIKERFTALKTRLK